MPDDEKPQSIREMAEGDTQQAAAAELFPMGTIEGDEATLQTMIQPGDKVTHSVSMNGTSKVPMSGGMLDIRKEHTLLVTCEVAYPIPVPDREGDRLTGKRITAWDVKQKLVPIYVERVKGEEGVIEAQFADLLRADENRAAALLDRLKGRVESALGVSA
jgi:hypothetical protein